MSVSNTEGMQALTAHLLETHRIAEPVFVAGPADSPDDAKRYPGFVQALASAGSLRRALVCGNDRMALGILDVFGPAGIRVPEDVIVTGFDGIEAGRLSTPRLITVHQPMADLARAAMWAMLSRLQRPDQPPITSRLPVEVLLRESSEGAL